MESPASIHLDYFPAPEELTEGLPEESRQRLENWDKLAEIRDVVLKSLDKAREDKVIGSSLEAAVTLEADGALYPLLHSYEAQLPALFIVSQVELKQGTGEALAVTDKP